MIPPSKESPRSPLATFHLTQTAYVDQGWGGNGASGRFREAFLNQGFSSFALTADPATADYILFCEEYQKSELIYAPKLRTHPLVSEYPEKVFIHSSEDRPMGFLSGLYCSLPRQNFVPARHRSCAYFGTINPRISIWEKRASLVERQWLFSFIGARTAPVRGSLFQNYRTTSEWCIRETGNQQFNIKVDDPLKADGQDSYLETILQSDFALCPRGYGTGSYRLFETMRLSRVPIILADNWVPPEGPNWSGFSIRLAESRISELPQILMRYRSKAIEMGQLARQAWEQWFAPQVYVERCLEEIHAIALARYHREVDYFAQWPRLINERRKIEHGNLNAALHFAQKIKDRLRKLQQG